MVDVAERKRRRERNITQALIAVSIVLGLPWCLVGPLLFMYEWPPTISESDFRSFVWTPRGVGAGKDLLLGPKGTDDDLLAATAGAEFPQGGVRLATSEEIRNLFGDAEWYRPEERDPDAGVGTYTETRINLHGDIIQVVDEFDHDEYRTVWTCRYRVQNGQAQVLQAREYDHDWPDRRKDPMGALFAVRGLIDQVPLGLFLLSGGALCFKRLRPVAAVVCVVSFIVWIWAWQ